MGEYADMTLEGDSCAECGMPFDDAGDGFPRCCDGCGPEEARPKKARAAPVPCPACARKFHGAFALAQHRTAKGH